MEKTRDKVDNMPTYTLDEMKSMIGGPISGINMTPLNIMSGTLVGIIEVDKSQYEELREIDIPLYLLAVMTNNQVELSEEMDPSCKTDIPNFLGLDMDKYKDEEGNIKDDFNVKINTVENPKCGVYINIDINKKNILNDCIIMMPFSDMTSNMLMENE